MDKVVKQELIDFINTHQTHMNFEDALKSFPTNWINQKARGVNYTFYALVEHLRIAQHDILSYIKQENYVELNWPDDYWPALNFKASKKDFLESVKHFKKDQRELTSLINKHDFKLSSTLPNKKTALHEILLIIDHNSYHIGELAILRQVENIW